jgi:hypothetical protein
MAGGKTGRTGPLFWALLAIVIFGLYSVTVAAVTKDDCGEGVAQSWQVFPPEWECNPQLPGYG